MLHTVAMNRSPPIRIMLTDDPTKAELDAHLKQDGYFTTALVVKGPNAREFGRKIGILK